YLDSGQYDKALLYAEKGLKIAKQLLMAEDEAIFYSFLSKIFEQKKNFLEANRYAQLALGKQSTVYARDREKQLSEMEIKYETEKRQKELELVNKDNEIKQKEISKQKV